MIRGRINHQGTLGDRLKSARGQRSGANGRKLTQGGLAHLIGVDRNTVSRWENGAMSPSDPAVLASLGDALGVTVDWLISGEIGRAAGSGAAGSGAAGSGVAKLQEGTSPRYQDPMTTALAEGARRLIAGYLDRLALAGCSSAQRHGAELLLLAGARNEVSSVPLAGRDEAAVCAGVDAAWDAVVAILRLEGIRP